MTHKVNQAPSRTWTLILLAIGISAISISPILNKLSSATPLTIATYRMLWATLFTFLFYKVPLASLARLTLKQWLLIVISGISLALHFWSWIASLSLTTVAISTLLVSVHPIIVIPLSVWIFKERLSQNKLIGVFMVLNGTIGIALSTSSSQTQTQLVLDASHQLGELTGVLLALFGAFTIAIYLLIGKHLRQKLSNGTYTLIVYAVAALVLMGISMNAPSTEWSPNSISWSNHLLFIMMALFPTLLGHSLLNYLIQWMDTSTISIATLAEPIIASFFAWILFKETITLLDFFFGFIILGGIVITEIRKKSSPTSDLQ